MYLLLETYILQTNKQTEKGPVMVWFDVYYNVLYIVTLIANYLELIKATINSF